MIEESLKFLLHRVKKQGISQEEAERKVCQEIFIAKIGSDKDLLRRVSFKGGLIINQLAKGKRGYTKDIDFDLVKYPLSEEGIREFFVKLSPLPPYENIRVDLTSIEELRHKNYMGKRITASFKDNESEFSLTMDIGVHLPLIKRDQSVDYEIAFGGISHLSANPVERMIAEKLSTFAIYGTDNTRDKDLFDAYWLITNMRHDKTTVKRMLTELLVRRSHFFKTLGQAIKEIKEALDDEQYVSRLNKSRKNWTGVGLNQIIYSIDKYIGAF